MDKETLDILMEDIYVRNIENEDVEVVNNTSLQIMGKGRQGAVFQLSDDQCIKVFGNTEDCEREYYALSLGQHTNLFPRIYEKGSLYISMEIIKGVDLREYLQSQPLTEELAYKLIEMLIIFKEIGFERIDHHKRQIFVQTDGNLKVIDVARTVWRDRVYPYPRKLLTSLGEVNKGKFLAYVQALAPALYEEWLYYIEMEELSRQICQTLFSENIYISKLESKAKMLLTKDDEQSKLEGLVYKVYKEEWIKSMMEQGYNPDEEMKKIDQYWIEKEMSYGKVNLQKYFSKLINSTNTVSLIKNFINKNISPDGIGIIVKELHKILQTKFEQG
ncbi:hypothetical protein [Niallia sp. 03133]|uniref:hypothetical protein n=1 Tax=Niallia sp. 03133 TaxID=3458060 RepID=UPI004043AB62